MLMLTVDVDVGGSTSFGVDHANNVENSDILRCQTFDTC